jgi:hypothetical protein
MGRNAGALWVAALLALVSTGCGTDSCPVGETGIPPNCQKVCPAGTLPPDCHVDCTQTNIYQQNGAVPTGTLVYLDFSVPDSGRLDVTMDWTNASSAMGFYLVPANTCALAEFNARSCNFIIRSEPSSIKPRKVSQASLAAGNYRWIVANFSSSDESAALQIVLSKGTGCPAFGGAPPSVLTRVEETLPAIGHVQQQR